MSIYIILIPVNLVFFSWLSVEQLLMIIFEASVFGDWMVITSSLTIVLVSDEVGYSFGAKGIFFRLQAQTGTKTPPTVRLASPGVSSRRTVVRSGSTSHQKRTRGATLIQWWLLLISNIYTCIRLYKHLLVSSIWNEAYDVHMITYTWHPLSI